MATKKAADAPEMVEAFVLCTCVFGECGSVIELTPEDAAIGQAAGMLDLHPDAIEANR